MRTSLRTFVAYLLLLGTGTAVIFAATENYLSKYNASGALVDSVIYESGGSVGIGTTSPANKLDVAGAIQITGAGASSGANRATIDEATTGWSRFLATGPNTSTRGKITLSQNASDGSLYQDGLTIDSTGNVGVGTSGPTAKLHVAGDIKVDGNIAAKYQDVAEWVDSVGPLAPGTLVVIDASADNRVKAATESYDSHVAGAVSAAPGLALGEPGIGKVLVAQSGRVRIKADATYGAIHVGDLLVSSPTKGMAMRSMPVDVAGVKMHRPGTLVGKALQPLQKGVGEILVLLTLQ